jgi:hypothetical protein
MAPAARTKRSEQIPLVKAAAIALADKQGEPKQLVGQNVTEVDLGSLYFWITAWPYGTSLDVWDRTLREAKVCNLHWTHQGRTEVVTFHRGEWEQVLLDRARWMRH